MGVPLPYGLPVQAARDATAGGELAGTGSGSYCGGGGTVRTAATSSVVCALTPGGPVFTDSEEMLRYLDNEGIRLVDVRFCDLLGTMQHFNVPVGAFDESVFSAGVPFDGSSIRGFQKIHESDMVL